MSAVTHVGQSMTVASSLHLREGEALKVIHFALLGLVLQLGLGIGFSAGDALFISNLGAKSLPLIFALTPLAMLVYTPIFSWLVGRLGMQRICQHLVASIAVVGVVLFVLMEVFAVKTDAIYYFIKLYLTVLYISVYSVYWMVVDDFFSVADGKRLYPLLSVGCSAGTAIGALLVSAFADRVPSGAFFLIWAFVAALTIPVLATIPRFWARIPDHNARRFDEKGATNFLAQQTTVLRSLLASRFALSLCAMLFLTLIATNIIEYQYSAILGADRSEVELVEIMGQLYGVAHVFNILVGLFGFSPTVRRYGVKNVALILPSIYMAAFVLLFMHSSFITAAIAFWAYHGVLTSVEYNNQNLLFNALPAQTRRALRTMIEGLCEPLASFVSGLFLLAYQESLGLRQIAGIALVVAALLVGVGFGVRNAYPAALSRNMRLGWLNLGAARELRISPEDENSVSLLIDAASGPATSTSAEAMELLIATAPARAMPIVLAAITDWPCEWHGRLEHLLDSLLQGGDEALFMRSLTELVRLDVAGNQIARRQLTRLALPISLKSDSFAHETFATLRSLRADDPSARASAFEHIGTMLAGNADQRRAVAEMLGLLGDPSFECELIRLLDDGDGQVRATSLSALQQLTRRESARVADAMLKRFSFFKPAERKVALAILDVSVNPEQLGAVLEATALLSASEMRDVEDILTRHRQLAVPVLVVVVSERSAPHSSRRVAARALSRLSLRHLEAIHVEVVAYEIGHMEMLDERARQIRSEASELVLLADYYDQKAQSSLELVLEILALVGTLPDFDLIAASLQSSSAKVRADAFETINSSLDRSTFQRIAGVIEPDRASSATNESAPWPKSRVITVLEHGVAEGDELESALAAEALACMSEESFQSAVRRRFLKGHAGLVSEVVDARAGRKRPSPLDLLRRARLDPVFAAARFETVLALLTPEPQEPAFWSILHQRAADLAVSHHDLAASMLRKASSRQ